MNNILISKLFDSKHCLNCNRFHIYCFCQYDTYFSEETNQIVRITVNNLRIIIHQNSNNYTINIKSLDICFITDDINIQDLIEKIQTYIIFQ